MSERMLLDECQLSLAMLSEKSANTILALLEANHKKKLQTKGAQSRLRCAYNASIPDVVSTKSKSKLRTLEDKRRIDVLSREMSDIQQAQKEIDRLKESWECRKNEFSSQYDLVSKRTSICADLKQQLMLAERVLETERGALIRLEAEESKMCKTVKRLHMAEEALREGYTDRKREKDDFNPKRKKLKENKELFRGESSISDEMREVEPSSARNQPSYETPLIPALVTQAEQQQESGSLVRPTHEMAPSKSPAQAGIVLPGINSILEIQMDARDVQNA